MQYSGTNNRFILLTDCGGFIDQNRGAIAFIYYSGKESYVQLWSEAVAGKYLQIVIKAVAGKYYYIYTF